MCNVHIKHVDWVKGVKLSKFSSKKGKVSMLLWTKEGFIREFDLTLSF